MTVPFTQLAPGQSMRLAWQVMGVEGPIPNPKGIRYLPADSLAESMIPRSGLSDVATAFAGVNLLLSAGTLALAGATLAEVRRISTHVERMFVEQKHTNKKLDQLIEKLGKLELKVSEGRLATLVDHAVHASGHGSDQLSFAPFGELSLDLEGFIQETGIICGMPASLRLGSDVRGSLKRICRLLRGVRLHSAQCYNARCTSPEELWTCNPDKDYISDTRHALAYSAQLEPRAVARAMDLVSLHAHRSVDNSFSLNSREDHVLLQSAINEAAVDLLRRRGLAEQEARETLGRTHDTLMMSAKPNAIPFLDDEFRRRYTDALTDAICASVCESLSEARYPSPLVEAGAEAPADRATIMNEWRTFWLHHTDVGLLYRTYRECQAIRDGYTPVFESTPAASFPAQLSSSSSGQLSAPVIIEVAPDMSFVMSGA